MKLHRFCIYAAALAAMAWVSGCASPRVGDPRIELLPFAARKVAVLSVGYTDAKDGARSVQLALRNRTGSYQRVLYKVVWFADGVEYQSILSKWKPASLQGREVLDIVETAPNAKLDSFRIQIKGE